MIAPEPTEVADGILYSYPSDEGLQSRPIRYLVTIADGMGAAGHLGILEDACGNPMHEMYLVESLPCLKCGAAV